MFVCDMSKKALLGEHTSNTTTLFSVNFTASVSFLIDGEGHNNTYEAMNSMRNASAPNTDKGKHVSFGSVS